VSDDFVGLRSFDRPMKNTRFCGDSVLGFAA
jgi:hypothetical protein